MLHLIFGSKRKNVSYQKGVTLVEFLIGFAFAGLIGILVAALYFAHFKLFSGQNTAIEVDTQNKLALNEIVNQVREGQQIVTTCGGCGGDTTSDTILILQLWPLDVNGEPFEPSTTEYDYIIYKQEPTNYTKLMKRTVADVGSSRISSYKLIVSNISNIEFTYNDADVTQANEVVVEITTTGSDFQKSYTITQSAKAVLRNK